jgi:hypothetical protein
MLQMRHMKCKVFCLRTVEGRWGNAIWRKTCPNATLSVWSGLISHRAFILSYMYIACIHDNSCY